MQDRLRANSLVSEEFSFLGEPCWDWTGALDENGYPLIGMRLLGKRHTFRAHRVALWAFKHVTLFSKRKARHLCHRKCCINPMHLKYGTQKQNVADQITRGTHYYPTGKKKR